MVHENRRYTKQSKFNGGAGVIAEPLYNGRKPFGFLFSAAVHGGLLALVAFGPRPVPRSKRPVFDSIIRPNEKKIIWYRKLPDISPTTKVGDAKEPRGEVKSATATIAMSPKPQSSRQLVLQSAPQIKLEHDLSAPNLLAVTAPVPPPAEPKRVKAFIAPPAPLKARPPDPVLTELDLKLTWTDGAGVERMLSLMRPKRSFVAPPKSAASKQQQPVVIEEAPPTLTSESPDGLTRLPALAPQSKVPARRFTPPSGRKSSDAAGDGLVLASPPEVPPGSDLTAAIVGLHPSGELDGPLPPGNRAAQFSSAPSVGKTATGEVNGAGAILNPELMINGRKPERVNPATGTPPAGAPPAGSRIVLYDDIVPNSLRPALSAPLRPASRTIPRALEARFQGRLVYTMVAPTPNLPAYTGDWIIWFAERAPTPGEVPLMRAPVPFRKIEPLDSALRSPEDRAEARIQLGAIIRSNGTCDSITILNGLSNPQSQSAIADLKRWEFRPVLRNGSPIDVEVVIEIPFSLVWLRLAQ